MLGGTFTSSDVVSLSTRVLVNGVQRDVVSWSVDRELHGDLPSQVTAVNGVSQASGTIVWGTTADVSEYPQNPWSLLGGWIPGRGDRVEIFVSDGDTEWKQFHGLIDSTRGDTGGVVQSTIIDEYDRLSAEVSHITMLGIMPPRTADGSDWWRLPGIHPLYYVDLALRRARFYVTPPRENNSLLEVPLQGSLWPHWGVLDGNGEDTTSGGSNRVTPWGLGKANFIAYYSPSGSPGMGGPVQVSFMVAPNHAGTCDVTLDFGVTDWLRVRVDSARVLTVWKNSVTVATLNLGAETIISVLFKAGAVSVRTNANRGTTGTYTVSGAGLSRVRVNASVDANIAGLQVSEPGTPTHEHFSTRVPLTARFDTESLRMAGNLHAAPNIEGYTAHKLIQEINDALLAAMWIDENGHIQWAQSDTLRRRDPVRTVTTRDDIFSLSWESGLLQSASSVTVKGRRPSVTRTRRRSTTLAEGKGNNTLSPGDVLEIFLGPGTDEDWVMPSFDFLKIGVNLGGWASYNNPTYGVVGLYYEVDGEPAPSPTATTTITTHKLGNQKALIKYIAGSATWPAGYQGVLSTPPEHPDLWARNLKQPLPRLVGMGRVKWYDDELTLTGAGGPGPELVHDVGVWSNHAEDNEPNDYWQRIGEYLQSQVAVPQPVITGIEVAPDPRLQLGDVVTIQSEVLGITLKTLITSLGRSFDDNGFTMTLGVRVIDWERDGRTYTDFDDWIPGTSSGYRNFDASIVTQNLSYLGLDQSIT